MTETQLPPNQPRKKIRIIRNGPYIVEGDLPLVQKTQVVTECGEPVAWKKEGRLETSPGGYALCRCGQSSRKPFCDGTHRRVGFDGTECADEGPTTLRQETLRGARLIVKRDPTLCTNAGFCGLRGASLEQLIEVSEDTGMRSLVMAMVERCPSGALTYQVDPDEGEIEPDLPEQVAATTEILAEGPITGPLWVTGGIPVERSDGLPLETRNRVTLCNCGQSRNKPLCDGCHRLEALRRGPLEG